MTEKELIRHALLGNKQAQKECTEKGIVLPCPFCGGNKIKIFCACGDYFMECSSCHSVSNIVNSHKQALKLWNTRSAPPIGRCGECKNATVLEIGEVICHTNNCDMLKTDFCSYFEPKEE